MTVATCRCCGREYSLVEWRQLPLVGRMFIEGDSVDPVPDDYMLRNCTCPAGTTLAIETVLEAA